MALTVNFTVSQSALAPNLVVITDTSTGSDVLVTQRRVFVQTAYGTYLVPDGVSTDYTQWTYADATINLNILDQDTSASTTVQWLNVSNSVLYTLTQVYCFSQYNRQFFYYLIQQQALVYTIMGDSPYFKNLAAYWVNIISAEKAIEIGADVAASQACLDRATEMKTNQNPVFSN